ncbi:hypothetical protein B0H66DRAFT_615568 [Apodospora peruviana]|uniref:G domain-containing protein n=1 Tax=Apodospora peruviana TaxID=516989 RepID=A0AAE0IH98_9PEZI|nr:hypothetical protein B0H66DRAFT_615568 [Apodospora peruviana]
MDNHVQQPEQEEGGHQSAILSENDSQQKKPEAVVVVIMGMTGSGKSTFISLLADEPMEIKHGLKSDTTSPGMYSFRSNDKTVILVDTSSFDDVNRADAEVLKDLALFLSALHKIRDGGARFGGVVYLHRITDSRMAGSGLKNLRILRKVCGPESYGGIVLVTNMWGEINGHERGTRMAKQREVELQKPEFWGPMIERGSRMVRHDGTKESAMKIVQSLVDKDAHCVPLDIQRELAIENKPLSETQAGQYVQMETLRTKERYERELVDLRESIQEAVKENDKDALRVLEKEKVAAEVKIAKSGQEFKSLNVTMEELLAQEQSPLIQHLVPRPKQEGAQANETCQLGNITVAGESVSGQLQPTDGQIGPKDATRWRSLTDRLMGMLAVFKLPRLKGSKTGNTKDDTSEKSRTCRKTGYQNRSMSLATGNPDTTKDHA